MNTLLESLENTNSSNEKIKILQNITSLQKRWFKLCYDNTISFGIKKIPTFTLESQDISLEKALDFIELEFGSRNITGNSAIESLRHILSNVEQPDAVIRLIKRDAKCGVNKALLNKVYPGLIPEIPCMLASPMNEKTLSSIKYPAFSQLKADGMRVLTFINSNRVKLFTRNGTEIINPYIEKAFKELELKTDKTILIDGEMICYENGEMLDRKTSNGICNKILKNTASDKELRMAVIQAWDIVELNDSLESVDNKEYSERFEILKGLFNNSILKVIPSLIVNSREEAFRHFDEMIEQGLEGTILKNTFSLFENKRSKNQVKLKAEKTVDLLVYSVEKGEGDFSEGLGSLKCISRDNKIVVSVGTGLTMEDRGLTYDLSSGKKEVKVIKSYIEVSNRFLGKIIEVKYNDIIKSKDKDEYSLFLPRFIKIRDDKDTANSIDEI